MCRDVARALSYPYFPRPNRRRRPLTPERGHDRWCCFLCGWPAHNQTARIVVTHRRIFQMQRLAPTLALSLFLLFNLSTSAQENKVPEDSSAVRATVTNYIEAYYIEAYYTGDARRMEQTLDPHYLKHIIHGNIPMREKTAPEMLEEVRTHGIPDIPQTQRTEQ